MKRLIVSEFVSLDGVMEAPGHDGSGFAYEGWTMPYASEQLMQFKAKELAEADSLLLGRITYEGFAAAWPTRAAQHDDFADKMNAMPKYVVSNTLSMPKWENSHILTGTIGAEVAKLKEIAGGSILVAGSGLLVAALMQLGMVDEYRLLVYPLVLGIGKRLFKEGAHASLELVEATKFDTGVMLLRYHPAK